MAVLPGRTIMLGNPETTAHQVSQIEMADWMQAQEDVTGPAGQVVSNTQALSAITADVTALQNQAFVADPIYDDTATGLAATVVGDQFKVVNADPDIAYDVYQHDTGAVATLVASIPSPLAVATLVASIPSLLAVTTNARDIELVIEDRIPAPVALSQFTITPTVDGPVIDLETNGTDGALWMAVVPDGALEPSWSQIEAGTDGTGAPAIYATSIEVGALDTAFSFDPPVVGGELYDCYVFHKLSDGHSSRRVVASFSGLSYVATGGQDGTAGDLTIYSGGVFSDNQPDANGGNTAVNLVDANDGLTGQLGAQFNITLPARTILFSAKVKKQAGYFDGFRVSTQNLSESYFATVDLTSGALLDDSFPSGMTVADLGGGWWEMSTSLDVSTWADLTGKILLTARNGTGAAVLRDGSNILTISDAVIL